MSMKTQISRGVYAFLMKRSRRRCEWCGSQNGIHIDHIRPRCCGGTNRKSNLQVLCERCGGWKGGDPPDVVIKRIKRLKLKGAWERNVKHWGLLKMTEFVDKELEAAESEIAVGFDNPLEITLGEGKVQMQHASIGGVNGLLFGMHGESGEIGSEGAVIAGETLKRNQVFVRCLNRQSAEALLQVAQQVLLTFFSEDEFTHLPMVGLPDVDLGDEQQASVEVVDNRSVYERQAGSLREPATGS